jgi:hypothetical protein
MLGYPTDVGFAIGFLRRIKEMVWVLFGLVGLGIHRMGGERGYGAVSSRSETLVKMQSVHGEELL